MSGGSNNYLCYAVVPNLQKIIDDMEDIENTIQELGFDTVAADVSRLKLYAQRINCMLGKLDVMFDDLRDVFHDVEWYKSADIGKETLCSKLLNYSIKNTPIEPPELNINPKSE